MNVKMAAAATFYLRTDCRNALYSACSFFSVFEMNEGGSGESERNKFIMQVCCDLLCLFFLELSSRGFCEIILNLLLCNFHKRSTRIAMREV
jgi:hypothetical protein